MLFETSNLLWTHIIDDVWNLQVIIRVPIAESPTQRRQRNDNCDVVVANNTSIVSPLNICVPWASWIPSIGKWLPAKAVIESFLYPHFELLDDNSSNEYIHISQYISVAIIHSSEVNKFIHSHSISISKQRNRDCCQTTVLWRYIHQIYSEAYFNQ